jgi:hypothetical protein
MTGIVGTVVGVLGTPFHGTVSPLTSHALLALMINSYKETDHSVKYMSPVIGLVLFFAVIMYMNDMDLLLQAGTSIMSNKHFLRKIQKAGTDWARIILATDNSLKPAKCHTSVSSVTFVQDKKAKSKKNSAWPPTTITMPQKEGPGMTIHLIDPTEPNNMLGIPNNLTGDGQALVNYARGKGLEWSM